MGITAPGLAPHIMSHSDIHTPVLLERCVELLAPALTRPGAVLVDATEGMGGHSEALLERFPDIRLIGLDRDTDALRIAGERLARFGDRVTLVHTVYDGIAQAVASTGVSQIDGVLFDLGVSSLQLDEAARGFAYSQDAPLDMRMDQTAGTTAADIVATYGEGALRRDDRASVAAGWSTSSSPRPPPPCSATGAVTPRSACSRRCASRSTPNWRCSTAPSPPRWGCCGLAGASW